MYKQNNSDYLFSLTVIIIIDDCNSIKDKGLNIEGLMKKRITFIQMQHVTMKRKGIVTFYK